jgi:hypothetical protein
MCGRWKEKQIDDSFAMDLPENITKKLWRHHFFEGPM